MNPIARCLAELRKFGANAHLYLPGPGIPVLGPELVVNGDFANGATSWTLVTATIVSGKLNAISGTQLAYQNCGVLAGKAYKVKFDYTMSSGSALRVNNSTTAGANVLFTSSTLSAAGTVEAYVIAVADGVIGVEASGAAFSGTVDNISVKEITGYTNTISGITAGNYLDSAGTTNASVDNLVGLVLDAAGSVGAELLTNRDCSSAVIGSPGFLPTGWQGKPVSWGLTRSVVSKTLEYVDLRLHGVATGGYCDFISSFITPELAVLANEAYLTSFAEVNIVSGALPAGAELVYGTIFQNDGTYIGQVSTITTSHVDQIPSSGVNQIRHAVIISNITVGATVDVTLRVSHTSCRKVTGIHATQATTGNKPKLRRGLVNLLTWSNDLTNAVWSKTNATVGALVSGLDGGSQARSVVFDYGAGPITRLYQDYGAAANGAKYTFALWLRSATPCSMLLGIQRAGPADVEQTSINVTSSWQLFVFQHSGVFAGTSAVRGILSSSVPGFSANVEIYKPGLFAGTLTAAQILANGGIPVTTSAAGSNSSAGAYSWEFDGVDDRLTLSSAAYQMSDDHCVISAFKWGGTTGVTQTVAEPAGSISGAGIARAGAISLSASGILSGQWVTDDVAISSISAQTSLVVGETLVACTCARSGIGTLRKNSAALGYTSVPTGSATLTAGSIGFRGFNYEHFKGQLYLTVAIKGTVSDAQLLTIERGINALSNFAAGRF